MKDGCMEEKGQKVEDFWSLFKCNQPLRRPTFTVNSRETNVFLKAVLNLGCLFNSSGSSQFSWLC